MADLDALVESLYEDREPTWQNARTNAVAFVKQAIHEANRDEKYQYVVTDRVKERPRALAKVQRKFPNRTFSEPQDVEDVVGDWVGVKVTCNTIADAQALIVKLRSLCQGDDGVRFARKPDGGIDEVDYMKSAKDSGYRAYHAVVLVQALHGAKTCDVKVEIQIKTRLQDAWGELTHENFYKSGQKEPSPFHNALAKTMADLLAVVDDYATTLATQVAAEAGERANADVSIAQARPTPDESSADTWEVVTVFHRDPRYALAKDDDGNVGLIRALWVRDLLVGSGGIEEGTYISVDDVLNDGQQLLVTRTEDNDNLFFEPISLEDPADMEPDFDD